MTLSIPSLSLISVVDPGSADDPFSAANQPGSTGATDAADDVGQTGGDDQNDQGGAGQDDQSADAQITAEDEEALESYFSDRLQRELPRIQSGWDRQNQALRTQLQQTQEQIDSLRREARNARAEGLAPEDQAKLQARWDSEDAAEALRKKESATNDLFFNTYAFSVLTRFDKFGVTEEELLACETTDAMDVLAAQKQAEYYRLLAEGKTPDAARAANAPTDKANAPAGRRAPAGSTKGSDLGGGGSPAMKSSLLTEQGIDAMSKNIKSLFSEPGRGIG